MRFDVGQERAGISTGRFFPVLLAVTVGLAALTAAYFSQGSSQANPRAQSSSVSSSIGSTGSSSAIQPAAQPVSASYPLVWGPTPVRDCSSLPFCIIATLGFAGNVTLTPITSVTTIIQGNATTVVSGSTTTITRSNGTTYETGPPPSYYVTVTAFVQDAVTGQNATGPNGPLVDNVCFIHSTGLSQCVVAAPYRPVVPSGDSYKVTLFVTKDYTPCLLSSFSTCTSQLLALPSPTVTGAF